MSWLRRNAEHGQQIARWPFAELEADRGGKDEARSRPLEAPGGEMMERRLRLPWRIAARSGTD
jgi:hypothetical protein